MLSAQTANLSCPPAVVVCYKTWISSRTSGMIQNLKICTGGKIIHCFPSFAFCGVLIVYKVTFYAVLNSRDIVIEPSSFTWHLMCSDFSWQNKMRSLLVGDYSTGIGSNTDFMCVKLFQCFKCLCLDLLMSRLQGVHDGDGRYGREALYLNLTLSTPVLWNGRQIHMQIQNCFNYLFQYLYFFFYYT